VTLSNQLSAQLWAWAGNCPAGSEDQTEREAETAGNGDHDGLPVVGGHGQLPVARLPCRVKKGQGHWHSLCQATGCHPPMARRSQQV
jgi:hypothetical protein